MNRKASIMILVMALGMTACNNTHNQMIENDEGSTSYATKTVVPTTAAAIAPTASDGAITIVEGMAQPDIPVEPEFTEPSIEEMQENLPENFAANNAEISGVENQKNEVKISEPNITEPEVDEGNINNADDSSLMAGAIIVPVLQLKVENGSATCAVSIEADGANKIEGTLELRKMVAKDQWQLTQKWDKVIQKGESFWTEKNCAAENEGVYQLFFNGKVYFSKQVKAVKKSLIWNKNSNQ